MQNDCSCNLCSSACEYRPGWFKPGEAEKAAALLGLTLEAFFQKYLAVDWHEGDGSNTFLLAPAIVGEETGHEYPPDPRGACIFYQKGLCSIHAAKPFECRAYFHDQSHDDAVERHDAVAAAWETHQEQIVNLLGREPEASEMGSLFDFLFG